MHVHVQIHCKTNIFFEKASIEAFFKLIKILIKLVCCNNLKLSHFDKLSFDLKKLDFLRQLIVDKRFFHQNEKFVLAVNSYYSETCLIRPPSGPIFVALMGTVMICHVTKNNHLIIFTTVYYGLLGGHLHMGALLVCFMNCPPNSN